MTFGSIVLPEVVPSNRLSVLPKVLRIKSYCHSTVRYAEQYNVALNKRSFRSACGQECSEIEREVLHLVVHAYSMLRLW